MALRGIGLGDAAKRPGWAWWLFVVVAAVILVLLPDYVDISVQLDLSIIFVLALLALSMSFLWGYVGMLSFGQTVFFGLGGYSYAVLGLNIGSTSLPFLVAILLPMLFAAILGYFMIYGRISDIYLSVITLVVTLIFEKGIRATSGDRFVIGSVRLNGQNGIPTVPSLQVPWSGQELDTAGVFRLAVILLILIYVGLRLLLTSHFGRVLVGIRENERRIELLGYDSRRYKLAAFVLAGGIAGLAGALYGIWGNFVAPEMFNLNQAAQVVIWVIVGGKSTLIGPIVGTAVIQYATAWLGTQGVGQVSLILGLVLMVFVLIFQQGLLPTVGLVLGLARDRLKGWR
jgi:branched-chain amino acid transport system permease protein